MSLALLGMKFEKMMQYVGGALRIKVFFWLIKPKKLYTLSSRNLANMLVPPTIQRIYNLIHILN